MGPSRCKRVARPALASPALCTMTPGLGRQRGFATGPTPHPNRGGGLCGKKERIEWDAGRRRSISRGAGCQRKQAGTGVNKYNTVGGGDISRSGTGPLALQLPGAPHLGWQNPWASPAAAAAPSAGRGLRSAATHAILGEPTTRWKRRFCRGTTSVTALLWPPHTEPEARAGQAHRCPAAGPRGCPPPRWRRPRRPRCGPPAAPWRAGGPPPGPPAGGLWQTGGRLSIQG